jgi:hypothetical protein
VRRARIRSLLCLIALCGVNAGVAACAGDELPRFARPPGGSPEAGPPTEDEDAGAAR